MLTELRELRELQVQHARVSYSEAAKRQSESVNLDLRVKELNGRLEEVDEQMVFHKDTLYSVLTSGFVVGFKNCNPEMRWMQYASWYRYCYDFFLRGWAGSWYATGQAGLQKNGGLTFDAGVMAVSVDLNSTGKLFSIFST